MEIKSKVYDPELEFVLRICVLSFRRFALWSNDRIL
jgi:hypothetical protein